MLTRGRSERAKLQVMAAEAVAALHLSFARMVNTTNVLH